jgi:hypothetical protein
MVLGLEFDTLELDGINGPLGRRPKIIKTAVRGKSHQKKIFKKS